MTAKISIAVELQEFMREQKWPAVTVFVFSRAGRLLARKPFVQDPQNPQSGRAEFEMEIPERVLVAKIGPEVGNIRDLDRDNPVVNRLVVPPDGKAVLKVSIPKPGWGCWVKVPYLVTGTVEKQQPDHNSPICWGEVDIYDVDLGYCFPRLSDAIIERLRDAIIDLIIDPPPIKVEERPWWPRWELDPPGEHEPREIDIARKLDSLPAEWGFARQRVAAQGTARNRLGALLERMPVQERQAWFNREAVEGVKIAQILQANTTQLRELLAAKFLAFRYWLCWYPWIYWLWWPWCWYSLQKLGTAKLQPGGHFSLTVWLSVCRSDIPDLWFVVRQSVNGVERVIYARHPVPCHTYWDHPSGKPVYLLVTDSLALPCPEEPGTDLDPTHLWIVPLAIGNYSLKRIYGTGAGNDAAKIGLYKSIRSYAGGSIDTFYEGPFGGEVGLRFLFSHALAGAGVKYYRIKSRVNGTGQWTALGHEVVRHYSHYDPVADTLEFKQYPLGPQPVGSEKTLFEIPPQYPPNHATEPDADWYVNDATVDLMNGYFDTTDAAPGYVEFKLELFNSAGVRVNPPTVGGGISIKLPSTEDVWGTLTTESAAVVNPALIVSDPEDAAFETFLFQLVIDNRTPTAIVEETSLSPSGTKVGICGVMNYAGTDTSVNMPYQAKHPARFAQYRFWLVRAAATFYTSEGQVGDMATGNFSVPAPINSITNLRTITKPDGTVVLCPMVAFSENLYIWNMAFNGWSRVGPDASAVRAFALAPVP
jgi:hypothetical protein